MGSTHFQADGMGNFAVTGRATPVKMGGHFMPRELRSMAGECNAWYACSWEARPVVRRPQGCKGIAPDMPNAEALYAFDFMSLAVAFPWPWRSLSRPFLRLHIWAFPIPPAAVPCRRRKEAGAKASASRGDRP